MTVKVSMKDAGRVAHEISSILKGEDTHVCICALGMTLSEVIYHSDKDPLKRRKILRGFYETTISALKEAEK